MFFTETRKAVVVAERAEVRERERASTVQNTGRNVRFQTSKGGGDEGRESAT